ncbi:hypothetical protein [Streptomyces yunnanensis]|uniref:hypothetical protein n=1 Tax=Streptomyces yunnanensis TaxID=156453 RepID=UPI00142E3290|nr:hypothetical protein [Streptomyces yunnanensis]
MAPEETAVVMVGQAGEFDVGDRVVSVYAGGEWRMFGVRACGDQRVDLHKPYDAFLAK